jgi:hypothetical protein
LKKSELPIHMIAEITWMHRTAKFSHSVTNAGVIEAPDYSALPGLHGGGPFAHELCRRRKLGLLALGGLELRTMILPSSFLLLSGSLVVAAGLYACGGAPPAPTTPAATADAAAPAATDAGGAAPTAAAADGGETTASDEHLKFDDLTPKQQVELMATKVVPDVGKVFKEFDGKKYEKFGCATCHGPSKGPKKEDPRNVLPKLTLSNGGADKLMIEKREMMKFMKDKVVPAMAAAMGEKPWDKATKTGFSCKNCHTTN